MYFKKNEVFEYNRKTNKIMTLIKFIKNDFLEFLKIVFVFIFLSLFVITMWLYAFDAAKAGWNPFFYNIRITK